MPATIDKTLVFLLALLTVLPPATSAGEKQLSVYAPVATYTIPVVERAGHEYVGVLELLEPLGRVSSDASGTRLKIRYNALDAEFEAGRSRSRIHGSDFTLAAPFLIENSRGLVPVASLAALLPRFLGAPVNFHEGARRLFIGELGIRPAFQVESSPQSRLLLNFSAPVNPTISTEPGKVRMVFKRDPVVSPGSQAISFENPIFTQASYSEANGVAEVDVAANIPLLATFSNNGKTITLSPAPTANSPAAAKAPASSPPAAPAASPVPRLVAVVDPAHGGSERGAALTDQLAEKDVTLAFARLLRHELELRGFAVVLLRDNDTTVPLDQRAGAANAAKAAVYLGLHAASQGRGVNVYTALLPVEQAAKGPFHPWNSAQASALPLSRTVAAAIAAEIVKRQLPVREAPASLRPLNNLLMPAVGLELAPGANGISELGSATYQLQAASAVADALLAVRDHLVSPP